MAKIVTGCAGLTLDEKPTNKRCKRKLNFIIWGMQQSWQLCEHLLIGK